MTAEKLVVLVLTILHTVVVAEDSTQFFVTGQEAHRFGTIDLIFNIVSYFGAVAFVFWSLE